MTPRPMTDDSERLLTIARSDLLVARTLLDAQVPGVRQEEICLHCHAAAEKSLKALAFRVGFEPPRTHRLKLLIDHVQTNSGVAVPGLPEDPDALSFLDAYSSVARYEDLLPKAGLQVAEMAYGLVASLVAAIEARHVQT